MSATPITLPDTRPSLTRREVICGFTCYISVSFDEYMDEARAQMKARPAEVFVIVAKQGSSIAGLVGCVCQLASIALQYGIPWAEVERRMLHHEFDRQGDAKYSSIVDGIAKVVTGLVEERNRVIGE